MVTFSQTFGYIVYYAWINGNFLNVLHNEEIGGDSILMRDKSYPEDKNRGTEITCAWLAYLLNLSALFF